MPTVQDIINVAECGLSFNQKLAWPSRSPRHRSFWQKLMELGNQRKTKEPEECQNTDATAFLSQEEHDELLRELRELEPSA